MEVTVENFKEALKILEEKLPSADFVCIDAEFSGLSTIKGPRFTYDTLEQKYQKAKNGSNEFLILQYGLCLFTWNKDKENYIALPFTFNIYPRPYKRFFNDVMFMVQSSCLDFLAQNNFDFNKLFYGGVSFIHPSTQQKVDEKFDKASKFVSQKEEKNSSDTSDITITSVEYTKVFIPKDKRDFIGTIISLVEKFVINTQQDSLDLPVCGPFERKLIYEVLEEKYPMGLYLKSEVNEQNQKFVKVLKITDKSKSMKFREEMEKERNILKEAGAFNEVMKLLVNHKKPIIGHNMFLDLFYTITNFFAIPPDTLEEFKSLVIELFPSIFDTKVIAATQPLCSNLSGTGLKSVADSIGHSLAPIDVVFDDSLDGMDMSQEAFHDAGYDALSTGKCFISLMKTLMLHFGKGDGPIDLAGNLIKPFNNRIFVMGIQDITYINLHKVDETPSRKGVYLVNFPKDWKENELHNIFSPISKLIHPIVWIDDTSAYVSIQDKQKHDDVMKKYVLDNQHADIFKVIPFPEQTPPSTSNTATANKRKHSNSDTEDGELSSTDEESGKLKVPEAKKPTFEVSTEW